jgi:hypothetical protein
MAKFYQKYNKVRLLHLAHEEAQHWQACVEKKVYQRPTLARKP